MKLETFFNKFDQFADAPNAVVKMRELVRHLAVTGTLVEQDESDESALALLDKIAAYKTALSKKGKLRGPTTVSPMSTDTNTRVLPLSWTWVRFGEIMVNRDGERIPVSKEERTTKAKTYDYYGASGVIDKIDGYLFDKPLLLIGEDGANLINRSTPIAFMARGLYWVNNHAHVLDGISEDFLRYIELHINAINLEPYVTGSAQPKMNQAKMNSIPIALPPLAEQKRIVAKVDELMALCDRLEALQEERETRHATLARASLARFAEAPTPANLDWIFHPSYPIPPADLRKAILTLAVQGKLVPQDPNDEPAELALQTCGVDTQRWVVARTEKRQDVPSSWTWLRFAGVGEQRLGKMLDVQKNRGVSKPYLRNTNVQWMRFELDDIKEMRVEEREEDELRLKHGDLLICEGGEPGRCAIWRDDAPEMYFQKALHRVRPCDEILSEFLALNLQIDCRNEVLAGYFTGATIKHLTGRSLRAYPIPIPPLAEQRRIVAKVEQLMALVDALETQLAASRATAANLLSALVAELTGTTNHSSVTPSSTSSTGKRGRPRKSS
ncbi:restriction endonuclease subunit S [Phragmitibacter flavus]|uniref:Restriction endonuclease subunit S n=1 Tax=Phragmitibacter flavus TaxID=2576071 RepID=A0A5R8KJK5_9BACT|nr:restriction endonuclease subunit S [Phragmitibacter flavus]TLD72472.1 restriction endonuclease subunit S [Phragmitibacter flavus]